ncbi:PilZ domain-containing protein [Veronia pacifica]|uniref:PilZ domain-containing protein n=2 Tax=Veronia pacifica TaxID=1080227 RepID=A0A1C3EK61_9GAMM|nr:hypothetical protein A8L45_09560 [Veronia pacifica]
MHEYHKEVQALLPLYFLSEFEDKLNKLSQSLPSAAKVLIKIELKRLMAPCNKHLDLRGKVQGDCRLYLLHNTRSWVDDVALNHYLKRLPDFGGVFTQGLYEELQRMPNSNRLLQTSEDNEQGKLTSPWLSARYVEFGKNILRKESRFNLSIPITAMLEDNTIVHGSTQNISRSGIKLRLTSAFDYREGDTLTVQLKNPYKDARPPGNIMGFRYRITRIKEYSHSSQWVSLGLALVSQFESESVTGIIQPLIAGKEPKRRFENQDKIENLRNRALEGVIAERTKSLPIYFEGETPRFVLLNANNQAEWTYWHDENNQHFFDQLFSAERIKQLERLQEVFFYCFHQHHNGKKYYLCAGSHELSIKKRHLLCQIGSQKSSWRVLRVTFSEVNRKELKGYPDLTRLSHIAFVQDITREHTEDYMPADVASAKVDSLTPFTRHKRSRSEVREVFAADRSHLSEGLKKVAIGHLSSTRYFIARDGDALSVRAFGISSMDNFLNQVLATYNEKGKLSLEPIFHAIFYQAVRQVFQNGGTIYQEFYVVLYNFGHDDKIVVKAASDFATYEQRVAFIVESRKRGQFIAVRNTMQALSGILNHVKRNELEALYFTASNKVRALESEMDQMCIYGELTDITDEVLLRATLKIRQPLRES